MPPPAHSRFEQNSASSLEEHSRRPAFFDGPLFYAYVRILSGVSSLWTFGSRAVEPLTIGLVVSREETTAGHEIMNASASPHPERIHNSCAHPQIILPFQRQCLVDKGRSLVASGHPN